MFASTRILAPSALVLASSARLLAAPADPTGHWDGAIQTPSGDVHVSIDVARSGDGTLMGTFSNEAEQLTGYPFANVVLDGDSVRLEIKTADPGTQAFAGTISADGAAFAGEFLVSVYAVPFSFERQGTAQIPQPPSAAAVDAALAGTWDATLALGARELPVALTLVNGADGSATGHWSAGNGTATPVVIAADGHGVTLTSTVTATRFAGTLSADGSALAGTFFERSTERALTFSRRHAAD